MKKIVAYQCEFCDKYRKTKRIVEDHEKRCFKNPDSQSCITCSSFNVHWNEVEEREERTCDSQVDLTRKLKTNCLLHRDIID